MSILQTLVQILAAWGPSHSGNRNVAQVARNVACNGVGKGPCSAIEHAIGFGSAYTVLVLCLESVFCDLEFDTTLG